MATFRIISQIKIGHKGPVAYSNDSKKNQLIHLCQGSMDGACGPYSMMMSLIILGQINRDDLLSLNNLDGRTAGPGKLLNFIKKEDGLFRNGAGLLQLLDILNKSYHNKLEVFSWCPWIKNDKKLNNTDIEIRKFILENIDNNNPVILDIESPANGHWVVVIGYEYLDDNNKKPIRFLLLDPNSPAPIYSAWNGIVDARVTKGGYPYIWWGRDSLGYEHPKVRFTCALALSLKRNERG